MLFDVSSHRVDVFFSLIVFDSVAQKLLKVWGSFLQDELIALITPACAELSSNVFFSSNIQNNLLKYS